MERIDYKLVNDTECEVVFFEKLDQVQKYIKDHKDHLITIYVSVATRWIEMDCLGGR